MVSVQNFSSSQATDSFHAGSDFLAALDNFKSENISSVEDTPASVKSTKRKLLTEKAAEEKARQIAEKFSWEPEEAMRDSHYSSLVDRLAGGAKFHPDFPEQQNDIAVIATYGDIIITSDKSAFANRKDLISDLKKCFQKLEGSRGGKELLDSISVSLQKGPPLMMRVSHNQDESIVHDFFGSYAPDYYRYVDYETKEIKNDSYIHNYDEIIFYPKRAKLLGNGKIQPPWMTLPHELKHRQKYDEQRAESLKKSTADEKVREPNGNPYRGTYDFFADTLDEKLQFIEGGNGSYDNEDDTAIYEHDIAKQGGVSEDLMASVYGKKGYAAIVFVDDPVHPKKIVRAVKNGERDTLRK